jgi:hypothetical protein
MRRGSPNNRDTRKCIHFILSLLSCLLLTGCPHNEYVVELKPQGNTIRRTLTFFCADGFNTNTGLPDYRSFPDGELAAISNLYPAGNLSTNGLVYVARADVSNAVPNDIGGSGGYSNFVTTLGSAAFYTERFRGDDDIATRTEVRLKAADQLADFTLGWSKAQFGGLQHYDRLREFFQNDFRRDLKNAGLYWWLGGIAANDGTNGYVEYIARFGQYLVDRGYFRTADLPQFSQSFTSGDTDALVSLVQRFVASKLGIQNARELPNELASLSNADSLAASWNNYLSTTPQYRQLLWKWREQRLKATWLQPSYVVHKLGVPGGPTNAPAPPKPEPGDIVEPLFKQFIQFDYDTPDDIRVSLELPAAPLYSDGRWEPAEGKVKWQRDIEQTGGSGIDNYGKLPALPAFFYAVWTQPDQAFQTAHFGSLTVTGHDLLLYNLWHAGLTRAESSECDALLAGIHPDNNPAAVVRDFHFSDEIVPTRTNSQRALSSDYLRELFKEPHQ